MAIAQIPPYYRTGTATFNATATVTFQGAGDLRNEALPGDQIFNRLGQMAVIETVAQNSITLVAPFAGTAQAAQAYTIYRVPDSVRLENFNQRSANLLAKGNLQSISDQEFAANKLIKPVGAGAVALQDFSPWAQSMLALPGVADRIPYLNAADTAALTALTGKGREIIGAADAAAARAALELLAVQSSVTDATANQLMRTGAFGLGTGAAPVQSDADAIPVGGIWSGAGSGSSNYPNGFMPLLHMQRNGNAKAQLLVDIAGVLHSRGYNGGSWSVWHEMLRRSGIVGTVSQSGGNPTGAIIQTGTVANGTFVRFADGTQWCWRRATLSGAITTAIVNGGGFRSNAQNVSWPIAFLAGSTDQMNFAMPVSTLVFDVGFFDNQNNTQCRPVLKSISSVASSIDVDAWLFAIGRWF